MDAGLKNSIHFIKISQHCGRLCALALLCCFRCLILCFPQKYFINEFSSLHCHWLLSALLNPARGWSARVRRVNWWSLCLEPLLCPPLRSPHSPPLLPGLGIMHTRAPQPSGFCLEIASKELRYQREAIAHCPLLQAYLQMTPSLERRSHLLQSRILPGQHRALHCGVTHNPWTSGQLLLVTDL